MEEGISLWTRNKARNWEIHPRRGSGSRRGHLSAMDEGKRASVAEAEGAWAGK